MEKVVGSKECLCGDALHAYVLQCEKVIRADPLLVAEICPARRCGNAGIDSASGHRWCIVSRNADIELASETKVQGACIPAPALYHQGVD